MSRPITPSQVAKMKTGIFPDEVLYAFNEAIAAGYVDGRSNFTQDEVIRLMVSKGLKKGEIYANHWLDVESIYQAAGWKVEYDKPAFNESYAANFTFTAKKNPRS